MVRVGKSGGIDEYFTFERWNVGEVIEFVGVGIDERLAVLLLSIKLEGGSR